MRTLFKTPWPWLLLLVSIGLAFWLLQTPAEEKFENALQQAPGCKTAQQCTVLYTECPLGCYHAVAKTALPALSRLAEKLVNENRSRACAYDCLPPAQLACQNERCVFEGSDG